MPKPDILEAMQFAAKHKREHWADCKDIYCKSHGAALERRNRIPNVDICSICGVAGHTRLLCDLAELIEREEKMRKRVETFAAQNEKVVQEEAKPVGPAWAQELPPDAPSWNPHPAAAQESGLQPRQQRRRKVWRGRNKRRPYWDRPASPIAQDCAHESPQMNLGTHSQHKHQTNCGKGSKKEPSGNSNRC